MFKTIRRFASTEEGTVTVDWFTLTFTTVALATLIATTVMPAIERTSIDATDDIDAIEAGEDFGKTAGS